MKKQMDIQRDTYGNCPNSMLNLSHMFNEDMELDSEQIVSAYFFTWSVSRANSTQWNYECWTAPFVAVSRAELFTQHQICQGGRRIRLQHLSQQPSSWQDHPNTLEGRRQFPPDPLMSLQNQVRSMCIQAKNFTPSHVQSMSAQLHRLHKQNSFAKHNLGLEVGERS